MNQETKDINIYNLAKSFLFEKFSKKNLNSSILDKYLKKTEFHSLSQYYQRLLESGANRNRSQGVISTPIGGIPKLSDVLFSFDVNKVLEKYMNNGVPQTEALLKEIFNRFKLRRNEKENGLWYKYCKTIISGAQFLSKFKDHRDFNSFVNFFHEDERARNALLLLLKQEIFGFGLALACDFLKESGYHWYAKPDVFLIKIFQELELSPTNNDYDVLNAIVRVAEKNNESPYVVDKVFWLIGSGKLYYDIDPKTNKNYFIGRNSDNFIKYIKSTL